MYIKFIDNRVFDILIYPYEGYIEFETDVDTGLLLTGDCYLVNGKIEYIEPIVEEIIEEIGE